MNIKKHQLLSLALMSGLISSQLHGEEIKNPDSLISVYKVSNQNLLTEFSKGNYETSLELSKKILKIDPSNESVKEKHAVSAFKLKKFKEVVNLYNDSQVKFLTSQVQLKARTISQVRMGNYIGAMISWRTLRSALLMTPEWKDFYHYSAYKLNRDSAFGELRRMNKAAPSFANDFIIGRLHFLSSNYDQANASFEAALLKDKSSVAAMELNGDAYVKAGKLEKALVAYGQIYSVQLEYLPGKIKISKILVRQGRYLDAIKNLEGDERSEILTFREKITRAANQFLNNEQTRSIAEEKVEINTIAESDGKLILEEKLIPKEIDVYPEAAPLIYEKIIPAAPVAAASVIEVVPMPAKEISADKSTLELGIIPLAREYNLNGTGFNANVEYSTGASVNLAYLFKPENRSWNSHSELKYTRVEFKDLNGLSPNNVSLSEIEISTGSNYLAGNFEIGPVLMYEKTTSKITSPSILRGNVDYFNAGAQVAYTLEAGKLLIKIDGAYYRSIVATAKTTALGIVDSHSIMKSGLKIYYEMRPMAYIFAGVSYTAKNTKYEASSGRGTLAAEEKENDVSFPLGINYAF